jgi:putative peptidoglycan lipid II flippase
VASTLRTAYALIVPFALLLPLIALDLSNVVIGWGAGRETVPDFARALALFAPGLVLFTAHYLMLRGFYALERTRTVFWVQCLVAGTNIVLAVLLAADAAPARTAPGLVVAYAGSYLVGAIGSYALLRRVLGGLETPVLVRFLVRLVIAAGVAAATAWAVKYGVQQAWPAAGGSGSGQKGPALAVLVLTGLVDVVVFLGLARMMRIGEVTALLGLVTSRLRH